MAKSKPVYGRGTGRPHSVDIHVGARVRMRRVLLGMTQTDLGDALGLTFQQVQKYENGKDRISASKLFKLSQVLEVTVEYFFEDMPPDVAGISPGKGRGKAEKLPSYEPDPMTTQETMRMVRSYYNIDDANVRRQVYELTKALGAADFANFSVLTSDGSTTGPGGRVFPGPPGRLQRQRLTRTRSDHSFNSLL